MENLHTPYCAGVAGGRSEAVLGRVRCGRCQGVCRPCRPRQSAIRLNPNRVRLECVFLAVVRTYFTAGGKEQSTRKCGLIFNTFVYYFVFLIPAAILFRPVPRGDGCGCAWALVLASSSTSRSPSSAGGGGRVRPDLPSGSRCPAPLQAGASACLAGVAASVCIWGYSSTGTSRRVSLPARSGITRSYWARSLSYRLGSRSSRSSSSTTQSIATRRRSSGARLGRIPGLHLLLPDHGGRADQAVPGFPSVPSPTIRRLGSDWNRGHHADLERTGEEVRGCRPAHCLTDHLNRADIARADGGAPGLAVCIWVEDLLRFLGLLGYRHRLGRASSA